MEDIYYEWEPKKLERNNFSNTLVYSARFSISLSTNCLDGLVVNIVVGVTDCNYRRTSIST